MDATGQPKQARRRHRMLMLTHRVPYPLDRGDRIRAYHILEYLSKRFDVSIACTSDEPVSSPSVQVLHQLSRRVAIQRIDAWYGKMRGLGALLAGCAVTPAYFYRRSLARVIRRWHQEEPFDVVLTYCTAMIHYARMLRGTNRVRHVIDLVDVDSVKWSDYAADAIPPLKWIYAAESNRLRRIESGRHDVFDAIAVVSDAEAQIYRDHVGEHPGLSVLRHGVNVEYFRPMPDADTRTLLFTGVLNYRPNADGITWFVERVMPALREKVPEARLQIVGRHATAAIQALGRYPGVEFVGSVPDVRDYLREATAVIAPLQIARGVQTKVLEAMASARAVVCSPAAADGIHAQDAEHLLVAASPDEWVDHLARILTNPDLRRRLGVAARQRVEQVYAWKRCLKPLAALIMPDRSDIVGRDRALYDLNQAA